MSDLIVIAYPDLYTASSVLISLQKMQQEYLVELEDACVVTKDSSGKVKLHQANELTSDGIVSGGFWGGLVGLLFLHPLLGMAVGMGVGSLGGMLRDYGIEDDFIRALAARLEPGTSAIFFLVRKMTTDKVLTELGTFGGHVLRTSLTLDQEVRIETALQHTPLQRIALSASESDLQRVLTSDLDAPSVASV